MLQLVGLVYVTTPKTKTDKPKNLLESPRVNSRVGLTQASAFSCSSFFTPEECDIYSSTPQLTLLCSEERHSFKSEQDRHATLPNRAGGEWLVGYKHRSEDLTLFCRVLTFARRSKDIGQPEP